MMPISAAVLSKRSPLGNARRRSSGDVEIVVHINEALGEDGRQQMKTVVEQVPGVRTASFNDNRQHLMVLVYDPRVTSSFNILAALRRQSV